MVGSQLRRLIAVAAAIVASLIFVARSAAVPINVHLRVEASASTLFEGNITTDSRTIEAPDAPKKKGEPPGPVNAHSCDVKDNGEFPPGSFGSAYGNPTTALYDMARSLGLAFNAYWYSSFHDFFVNGIGAPGAEGTESWGYAVNNTTASVGGCQFQVAPGSDVLWASNFGLAKHLLALTGPNVVGAGTLFTVQVTDGQTGEPIPGAAIGELYAGVATTIPMSNATDSSGRATISIAHAGAVTLKATRAESVRSNGLAVCVHAAADGSCGTMLASEGAPSTQTAARSSPAPAISAVAEALGVTSGRVYARRRAPRILRGRILLSGGGTLRDVRIRLERRDRGRCFNFSGSRERFIRARNCAAAPFFSVGGSESFSYLLPAPLPPGRYTYDIEAIDASGRITKLLAGVSHVIFRVK